MAAARVVAYSITTQRGDGGCWFTVRNIDAAVANEEKLMPASEGLLKSGIRVIATETPLQVQLGPAILMNNEHDSTHEMNV